MQLGNAQSYVQRRVEETVLHQVLERYLPAFIANAEQSGVPLFVQKELEAMATCGVFEHGLTHFKCDQCGHSRVLPFSCKKRSCSFCGARRMVETAAHLVSHVIPEVPTRQWVLSFPPPLRYLFGFDADLLSEALNVFARNVFAFYRHKARQHLDLDHTDGLHCGAVTVIQRARSDLALHPHFHTVALDGVFLCTAPDAKPVFKAVPEPTKVELDQVAWETCQQVLALLRARGKYFDADPAECDELAYEEPLLARCYAASVQGMVTIGKRAGQRLLRLDGIAPGDIHHSPDQHPARAPAHGFNLHAGVRIKADDRARLERVLRYILRPPICSQRLSWTPDGRVKYRFKKRWSDGSSAVVFEPLDFIAKIAALIPRPRHHLLRYHGVLAARSKLRGLVVPNPGDEQADSTSAHPHQLNLWPRPVVAGSKPNKNATATSTQRRMTWAQLLRRTFSIDADICPRCGRGRMRLVAVVTSPVAISALLTSLGYRRTEKAPPPARAPPQMELDFAGTVTSAA